MTTLLFAALLFAGPRLELSVGAGGSTNPFEFPEDSDANDSSPAQPGVFIPIEVSADIRTTKENVLRAGVDARLDGTLFSYVRQDPGASDSTSASDLNSFTGHLGIPLTYDPFRHVERRVRLGVGLEPFVGVHRETFTSHRDGLPLITTDNVDLSNRYSTNKAGARLDGDVSIGRTWGIRPGIEYARVDYLDDFTAPGDGYDSWDYDESAFDVDGLGSFGDAFIGAGYGFARRDYDERYPRDAFGIKVLPGTSGYEAQAFAYHELSLKAGWSSDAGKAVLRYKFTRRLDEHVGYLDSSTSALSGDFHLSVCTASLLWFEPAYSVQTYDAATVNFDPDEPDSERHRLSLEAGFQWPLVAHSDLFMSARFVDQASANSLYTYRAFSAVVGVRVYVR